MSAIGSLLILFVIVAARCVLNIQVSPRVCEARSIYSNRTIRSRVLSIKGCTEDAEIVVVSSDAPEPANVTRLLALLATLIRFVSRTDPPEQESNHRPNEWSLRPSVSKAVVC